MTVSKRTTTTSSKIKLTTTTQKASYSSTKLKVGGQLVEDSYKINTSEPVIRVSDSVRRGSMQGNQENIQDNSQLSRYRRGTQEGFHDDDTMKSNMNNRRQTLMNQNGEGDGGRGGVDPLTVTTLPRAHPGDTVDGRLITDDIYVEKMENICCGRAGGYLGAPPDPSCIGKNVFLGTNANARNLQLLQKMRITHVLNVAGIPKEGKEDRGYIYEDTDIVYEELHIQDREGFEIWPFFVMAHKFIDEARKRRGNVLIADPGVSRGGAIALAIMIKEGSTLLEATQQLKSMRRTVLANTSFMAQLVGYARNLNRLDKTPEQIKCPASYGRTMNRHRYDTAPLPMFW